ncbi:MAG TPA: hypothetical protein DCE41_08310 [Cytophagales bacterium]|nr:hypothetical protein [Cytophagales bacterium]HAA21291.1 hypothetical protein [Cytophagales bacterium]HAP64120.1 hypothetical protein [Cytophagales bacterium]
MRRDHQAEIRQQLDPEENLLWSGKPKPGIIFRSSDIFLIPFSLVWAGFVAFWFFNVWNSEAPLFFLLFGSPFILMGLLLMIGRFFIDAKLREQTTYGVTDKRIIIRSGGLSKKTKSLNIWSLMDMECSENKDGSGTISFGPKNPLIWWGNGLNWFPGMKANPQFDMIPDVRKVYNQIIELQRNR